MRKRRGSILIYVMMIFSVLMIMGTTLLMLTMQNVKNRRYYADSRNNRYYSESGIDEAEGIVREYIERAEEFAVKNTDDHIASIIEGDKVQLEKINELRLTGREDEIDPSLLQLFDVNGDINQTLLNNLKEDKFQEFYIQYFNELKNANKNFINLINDIEGYAYEGIDGDRVNVVVDNKGEYVRSDAKIVGAFKLDLSSSFIKDGIHKEVKVCYEIGVPKYSSMQSFTQKYIPISMTPLLTRGLVVNDNAVIGGKLSVIGDIYVKGQADDGVIMDSKGAELNIASGSLIASEGIRYSYDYDYNTSIPRSDQGAKISLIGGNLYTKNILFEELNQGPQGAQLKVDGKVYVKDDLQIYSEYAKVDIREYNGTSDGSVVAGDKIDNSSAIVLNTRKIGSDKTTIDIRDNLWLAGVAYIEELEDPAEEKGYAYQTGESMTVKGNYVAYVEGLKNSYIVNSSEFGERDIKYETGKVPLPPISPVTYYDSETRWYTLYDESESDTGKLEIIMGFKDKYWEKFPDAQYYSIDGLGEKFQIGVRSELLGANDAENTVIDNIKKSNELVVRLLKADKATEVGQLKIFRIHDDFIASIYVDVNHGKRVSLDLTQRGIANKNLEGVVYYTISTAKNSGKKNVFGDLIEADDHAQVKDKASVVFYNRYGGRIMEINDVELKDYKMIYLNLDAESKSEIFTRYAQENMNRGKLKGFEGINIGNKNNANIITGAIINGNNVLRPNYYNDPSEYDKVFKRKEGIARDKMYYMGAFEKKYDGDSQSALKDKTIEELSVDEYHVGVVSEGIHPGKDYVVTPGDYVDLSGDSSNNIDMLSSGGVYVNYNPHGVIISNKTETAIGGKDVLKINDVERGIVIIKGDLLIKGDFTFSGAIIVMGNLLVHEDADVNIHYDKMEVAKAVAEGALFSKSILKEDSVYTGEDMRVENYEEANSRKPEDPLKQTKWVVVK